MIGIRKFSAATPRLVSSPQYHLSLLPHNTLSPLDGRYAKYTSDLSKYFS